MQSKLINSRQLVTKADARAAGLIRYFTGVTCSRGHIDERIVSSGVCASCNREKAAELKAKDPEYSRQAWRDWYSSNVEKRRLKAINYYKNNKAKALAASLVHRNENRERLADKRTNRRLTDPVFAFNSRARCAIRSALLRTGFKKNSATEQLLGCSIAEFRAHIERQFLPGMTWKNMSLWEIDHIVPASSARNQEEAEQLNKASNLRPLWTKENRSKSARLTHLL